MKSKNAVCRAMCLFYVFFAPVAPLAFAQSMTDPAEPSWASMQDVPSASPVDSLTRLGDGTPPASFDLRNVSGVNYVTPIKNQGNLGDCWSFATMASVESNVLMQGGPVLDLSENNLTRHHGFDWGPDYGGNMTLSTAYLARMSGPGLETADPYHDTIDQTPPSPASIPRQRTLRQALTLDTPAEIKTAVMNYGAVSTNMYMDEAHCYQPSGSTYYYNGGTATNHAVTCIGWDDNKVTAGGAGAWLIKNSWGSGWGQSGCFWLSYNDTAAVKSATSFQTTAADAVANCYTHADFGHISSISTPYSCSRFTTGQGVQDLKSIGFFTLVDGANYTIKIYDTWSNGKPADLLETISGAEATQGFHMEDLSSILHLGANNDFAVYLYISGGGQYPQAFDEYVSGYTSACTANPGESYYSSSGNSWTDLTTFNSTADFSVYAYTVPEPAAMAMLLAGLPVLLWGLRRGRRR